MSLEVSQSESPESSGVRPTRVRYGVLAFSVSMAVLLYLDRMAISVPIRAIAADLDLSLTQVGDSVAAFFWCYALFQVPAGWLGDRWGGRRALTLYVVAWSLAMAGLGMATGLASLIVMRALLGLGQAGAYATTASFLRRWIPVARRGLANSSVAFGGRAGAVLAPALTPQLMALAALWFAASATWRPVFIAYGSIGLVWAVLYWLWFRDDPRQHPRANEAEIALIAAGDEALGDDRSEAVGPIPFVPLLASRNVWLLSLVSFCINVGWIFLATWLPTYLMQVHHFEARWAGFVTSLTAGAGMAGCLAGGAATDFLLSRIGLPWARRIPAMFSYGGAALGIGTCWLVNDTWTIVALLILTSFLGDFALGAIWASFQDIGGAYSGTVLGFTNMCGNIGAAVAISIIGRLVENVGWDATFLMASSAYLVGAVAWLGVDTRVKIAAARVFSPPNDDAAGDPHD